MRITQGINHIISNTCSMILGTGGLLLLKNTMDAHVHTNFLFYNNLKVVCDGVFKFLMPNTESTILLCFWWAAVIALFYLGTLLPDCDTQKSIIGRIIYIPVEHRTWTHAIWFPLIIFICSIWVPVLFYLGVGYLLHLFWDSLSVGGVCFLYPFSKYKHYGNSGAKIKKGHWLRLYRTGKMSEGIIIGILIVLTIGVSIYTFVNLI